MCLKVLSRKEIDADHRTQIVCPASNVSLRYHSTEGPGVLTLISMIAKL